MEYNTARPHLSMKEYGRHIQRMVDYILTIEDKNKRQEQAEVLIELMGFLNPHLKNVEDFRHKLWDHLFYISDFKLQVESPYPIPNKETYKEKPQPLPYPERYPKYAHLGKNLELVIDKALQETDKEKQDGFANAIAYYMKLTYSNWHKETVQDASIQTELSSISGGKLHFDNAPAVHVKEDTRQVNGNTNRVYTQNKNKNRQGFTQRNNQNSQKRQGQGGMVSNKPGFGNRTGGNNNNRNFKKKY